MFTMKIKVQLIILKLKYNLCITTKVSLRAKHER